VNFAVIQWVMGVLLMLFSTTMLPPMVVSLIYDDGSIHAFVKATLVTLSAGVLVWLPVRSARHRDQNLRLREGFVIVTAFWFGLGVFGALPLMLGVPMSFTDAVFESISGFTTTGATVLIGIDALPQALVYYRSQLHFFGGMGIIVLAVAILPMLGIGGMQLYRAETPGPVKDTKLTPRITETAKYLWIAYVGINVLCMLAYWSAGMDLFDAIVHAFGSIATGGFSSHDESFGYFHNRLLEAIGVFFMFVGGVNFSLHFVAFGRGGRLGNYLLDPEFRAYFAVLAGVTVFITIYLYLSGEYTSFVEAFVKGSFQTVSMATSTGFLTADFSQWPGAIGVLLVLITFFGGCAGSTAGGIKVVRWLLVYKQGVRELKLLLHPRAEFPVRLGNRAVPPRVIGAVWGFFSVYMVVFGVLMLLLMMTGVEQVTAFSAIATTLNNCGPGLGVVTTNFITIPVLGKWVCSIAMLLGRLEIFTVLVLFTPAFWQR
jgi:trk system potassium uptake protein TrkH